MTASVSDGISSTKLARLEFRVFRRFKEQLAGKHLLVACSGGRDSVALVEILSRLQSRCGFTFAIAYVNHGFSSDLKVSRYRQKAARFVQRLAKAHAVDFVLLAKDSKTELKSEAEMREFRHRLLRQAQRHLRCTHVVFAHHADDLFETRLLRLIRGTGAFGLRAMQDIEDDLMRPLLHESANEIQEYVNSLGIRFLNDPSNRDTRYLRNWLRHKWLSQLEARQPGGVQALKRSLEMIASDVVDTSATTENDKKASTFDRIRFESSSLA
ncbi:MAG TPA: tRNA lysidine(34) synthetase TilS, partial [Bdellovibrionales bacterium]|nr:tRNA lysidine(34) synthetase TilS [Bdellovibrionales bacterium]